MRARGETVYCNDMDPSTVSPKSRLVALLLEMPLGVFGAHRFYVGKIGTGVAMLFTLGGLGIWWLVDLILVASGEFRDADGKKVIRWMVDEELVDAIGRSQPGNAKLLEELEAMRHEMFDLQERVDFMERTLSQVRQSQRQIESTR